MIDVEIHEGGLYTDISIDSLGLPQSYGRWGFAVPYPRKIWETIGQEAVEQAQADAPVDTGFLRDHIQYNADDGGVEIVATAYYSAYQEYGTIYMNGRNYFEPAVRNAVEAHTSELMEVAHLTSNIVDVLGLLTTVRENPKFVYLQCQIAFGYVQQLIGLGCTDDDIGPLQGSLEQLFNCAQQMMEYQTQYQQSQSRLGALGNLAVFIAQLLAEMILAIFQQLLDLVSYTPTTYREHNRIFF